MAGRESAAVERAVELVVTHKLTVSRAAQVESVSRSSIHRAIARRGLEQPGPPAGENHWAYSTGRAVGRYRRRA